MIDSLQTHYDHYCFSDESTCVYKHRGRPLVPHNIAMMQGKTSEVWNSNLEDKSLKMSTAQRTYFANVLFHATSRHSAIRKFDREKNSLLYDFVKFVLVKLLPMLVKLLPMLKYWSFLKTDLRNSAIISDTFRRNVFKNRFFQKLESVQKRYFGRYVSPIPLIGTQNRMGRCEVVVPLKPKSTSFVIDFGRRTSAR